MSANKHAPRRHTRLYCAGASGPGGLSLDTEQIHYLRNVLRMKPGQQLLVFDGNGSQWQASITQLDKKTGSLYLEQAVPAAAPPRLNLTLVQGISKGDRMDTSIQKAVELGVNRIVPLLTQWGDVRLDGPRMAKKHRHWQQVAISACEQCGRAYVPGVEEPVNLSDYLRQRSQAAIFLDPRAENRLSKVADLSVEGLDIIIGPEGGFSDTETQAMQQSGCHGIRLGPRILRTETAGPAVIAALQALRGDFT